MNKWWIGVFLVFGSVLCLADELKLDPAYSMKEGDVMYETLPGTVLRDYSKPALKYEDGESYQTLPGVDVKDYSKPSIIVERD